MNKYFKTKFAATPKQAEPKTPTPRTLEEVNKVYSELCARAGQLQYGIKTYREQLEQLNTALKSVIAEGEARTKLDQETKAAEPKKEGSND